MKVAIPSQGPCAGDQVDRHFGRAPKFVLYDTDSKEYASIDNTQNLQAAQGAGIQSATTIANAGAQAVLSGNCGPKAFRTLSAAGIEIYEVKGSTCKEAVELYLAGKLSRLEQANAESHWV